MNTLEINIERVRTFIEEKQLHDIAPEVLAARQTLVQGTGKGNDYLGWIDLPEEMDPKLFDRIEESVRMAEGIDYVVVIGIGGSYLGARAVIDALQFDQKENRPTILYAGHTLSEDYYAWLLNQLKDKEFMVIVISKSGTTTEPAVAFRILKQELERRFSDEAYWPYGPVRDRITAITDAQRGALHDMAVKEGWETFIIPDNVGGRFSVLTPVGLLPIAMAGHNVRLLIEGARDMRRKCLEENDVMKNPAMLYAAVRNLLYRQGRKVEMMVNFTPNLSTISEWWKQLYGESEGKDGRGILPHSLSFTTDLHSMGQYVQQGERLMFETVLSVKNAKAHVDLPYDLENLDGLNYLRGKSLTEINHCAELGTAVAHQNGGVPILRLELPRVDEYWLGQLIYLYEFACGISGYMLGVNPFDQPGVEAYKKNMFTLLGKPGYEGRDLE